MIGLAAAPAVQWLVATEPRVQDAIRAFAAESGERSCKVAGLPRDARAIQRYLENKSAGIQLPTITLDFERVRHPETGEPFVKVTCSDDDLSEIQRWIKIEIVKEQLRNGELMPTQQQ